MPSATDPASWRRLMDSRRKEPLVVGVCRGGQADQLSTNRVELNKDPLHWP